MYIKTVSCIGHSISQTSSIGSKISLKMVDVCISSALLVVSYQSDHQKPNRGDVANVRHLANFHPSIWGDHFSQYSKNGMGSCNMQQEIQVLKADVRRKLEVVSDAPLQHLKLIGDIEGLGLGYHFEEEIEEAIGSMFQKGDHVMDGYDLYHSSLHFRLLRQHGYKVPSDIFSKYVDAYGCIKPELHGDIQGLLGLYEAAQLRTHDDVILEEALNASIGILESSPLTKMDMEVKKALKLPFHKDIPRLRARKYISTYAENKYYSHDANLLKMAKLDFNFLQQLHQHELSHLSIWWKDLGLASKCPFARDRVVEVYLWSLAMLSEPQYGLARTLFTKVFTVFTVMDDTYDAYGTANELELLTEAVNRWDKSLIYQMPAYMRATYQALLDVFEEIEGHITLQGKSYKTHYVLKALQNTTNAYHEEYKWFKGGQIPTMEEYLRVALITVAVDFLAIGAMVGMRDDAITKESFEWILNNPKMITACGIIGRLKDDIASHKFEQERGHAPSSVECYMNQYGVSEQETYTEFGKQVTSAWKDMNECCLRPTPVHFKVLQQILNTARNVEVFYTDGDGMTQAQDTMKNEVTALLIHPIPI